MLARKRAAKKLRIGSICRKNKPEIRHYAEIRQHAYIQKIFTFNCKLKLINKQFTLQFMCIRYWGTKLSNIKWHGKQWLQIYNVQKSNNQTNAWETNLMTSFCRWIWCQNSVSISFRCNKEPSQNHSFTYKILLDSPPIVYYIISALKYTRVLFPLSPPPSPPPGKRKRKQRKLYRFVPWFWIQPGKKWDTVKNLGVNKNVPKRL